MEGNVLNIFSGAGGFIQWMRYLHLPAQKCGIVITQNGVWSIGSP